MPILEIPAGPDFTESHTTSAAVVAHANWLMAQHPPSCWRLRRQAALDAIAHGAAADHARQARDAQTTPERRAYWQRRLDAAAGVLGQK